MSHCIDNNVKKNSNRQQDQFPLLNETSLKPVMVEALITALAVSAIHFLSKKFFNDSTLLTKNLAATVILLNGSTIAIREGIELFSIDNKLSNHEKMYVRLIGALIGLVAGAGLIRRSSHMFSWMGFEHLHLKNLSLLALSQFLLIFAPSAYVRLLMEQKKNPAPLVKDQQVKAKSSVEESQNLLQENKSAKQPEQPSFQSYADVVKQNTVKKIDSKAPMNDASEVQNSFSQAGDELDKNHYDIPQTARPVSLRRNSNQLSKVASTGALSTRSPLLLSDDTAKMSEGKKQNGVSEKQADPLYDIKGVCKEFDEEFANINNPCKASV